MGYITFFPKNNDQNFQTIPEEHGKVDAFKPAD